MNYETSFQIIMHAGNAKAAALKAMDEAEQKHFAEARTLIEEATNEYDEGHRSHKQLLDDIMVDGKSIDIDLLLAHALDHLTSAEMLIIVAKRMIRLYEKGEDEQ